MAEHSTEISLLAARDAENGLLAIISLIDGSERVNCASACLSVLLRGVLNDISGCRDELENFNAEMKRLGKPI